ncbi:hypothetical protein [Benzoatithermus flavus]|uniref:Quinol:cytochrome c oxidoreductase quinone-binding subunit 2 n=1 Tax=Benzoatithermus flavus TaxID=3108223 RepID=A0ABU8XU63_9PROT
MNGAERRLLIACGIGALAAISGFLLAPRALLQAYLAALLFWAALPIGALGWVMCEHVTPGDWGRPIHETLAGACRTLPATGIAFLPILLALPLLYPWAAPATAARFADKAFWLTPWFLVLRTVLHFGIWSLLAFALLRRPRGGTWALGGIGLVVLVVTGSLAAVDWRLSLEPGFASSAYGLLFLMECGLEALAFAILMVLLAPPFPSERQRRILAAVLVGVVLLWAYVAFMQYLVIWSGDIPREADWYVKRAREPWLWLLWAATWLQGIVPFLALLLGSVRGSRRAMLVLCALILLGRLADALWLTLPAFPDAGWGTLLLALALVIGLGGAWLLLFLRLRRDEPVSLPASSEVRHA